MSLLINSLKAIFNRPKKATATTTRYPVESTPFEAKIGTFIEIDDTRLRSIDHMEMPAQACSFKIDSVGKMKNGNQVSWRLYDHASQPKFFMEVLTGENDPTSIMGVFIYRLQDKIFPQTKDDLDFWIGPNCYIGSKNFKIPNVTATFDRLWVPDEGHVRPLKIAEKMYHANGREQIATHECMLYSRIIDKVGYDEYLFVTLRELSDIAHIEVWTGIELRSHEFNMF